MEIYYLKKCLLGDLIPTNSLLYYPVSWQIISSQIAHVFSPARYHDTTNSNTGSNFLLWKHISFQLYFLLLIIITGPLFPQFKHSLKCDYCTVTFWTHAPSGFLFNINRLTNLQTSCITTVTQFHQRRAWVFVCIGAFVRSSWIAWFVHDTFFLTYEQNLSVTTKFWLKCTEVVEKNWVSALSLNVLLMVTL